MSRNLVVLVIGALLVGLVVAMVQAQDSLRRSTTSASPKTSATTSLRNTPGLADRLQGLRDSVPHEEALVQPAAAQSVPRLAKKSEPSLRSRATTGPNVVGSRKDSIGEESAAPDPQEPSVFTPEPNFESLQPAPPAAWRGAPTAAEAGPSVLKKTSAPAAAGGEFMAPVVKRSEFSRGAAPIVTPTPAASPMARTVDKSASSGRPARAPQSSTLGATAPPPKTAAPGGGQAETSALISSQSPVLRIETIGPAATKLGKEAAYTVQIVNQGEVEQHDVVVMIEVPAWVEVTGTSVSEGVARRKRDGSGAAQLVWEIERLPGQAQGQLQLKLVPQEGRPFELGVDWSCPHSRTAARVVVQEPQLVMTLSGPNELLYGETATYTITLSNPGTGDAENVAVRLLPTAGSARNKDVNRIGTIAAGQQKQVEIELTAREAGGMEVRVGAEADGGLHGEAVAKILVRRANVELSLEGPKLKYAGSVGVYQARITNTGNAPADDVVAAVTPPVGAKYLGGSEGGKPLATGEAWVVGRLEPGAQRVFELKCELNTAGENRLEVKVQGAGDLLRSAHALTQVEALADLKLSVVEPKGPRPVGEDAVYELHVANRGTKAARAVNVTVQFSEGLEPTATEGGRADLVPGQVIFHPLPRIDAGEEVTLRITARAEKEGSLIFRTEVKCADPETRLVCEGTTRFFGGDAPAHTASSAVPAAPIKKAGRPITVPVR